ncbi:vWA domain-containing protein [Aeromicrobium stalagmiti]|uniref:vWA domain-containing protein n=1 Tax=Aeromicrobium stalagmiti TaxID=2738988 RepID=UPI00156A0CB8|nr:VWA domain-containing protein [Aeromicrobium stalagmiti]NRQ50416.1 VWA domain-containing protein [Aeromicrobium stalagmiti]
MELNTRLDRDRFTWMSRDLTAGDRASMLVEVTAPPLPRSERVVATNLVVVLDRSGSMSGDPLEHAKRALCDVIDRLAPTDTFGLVTFDNTVDVVVPAGPVTDRTRLKALVQSVRPGGSTDLAAGLVRGLKEAHRLEATDGVRVLLVSDGHANAGVTDPDVIGRKAREYLDQRISTSALGMGLGYDEVLLEAVSRSGAGNNYFAQEVGDAVAAIGAECGELLAQRFLSVRLSVVPGNGVKDVRVLGDLNVRSTDDGVQIELGSFTAEQTRSVVLQFDPKQAPKPGRRKVATVRLTYVLADDLGDYSTSQTVWAKVAGPNDRPARIDRDVAAEVIFQGVQRHKRRATDALQVGDIDAAKRRYERALRSIRRHWDTIPRERRPEFEKDRALIESTLAGLEIDSGPMAVSYASKRMSADIAGNMRTRDRRRPNAC